MKQKIVIALLLCTVLIIISSIFYIENTMSDWAKDYISTAKSSSLIPDYILKEKNYKKDITRLEFSDIIYKNISKLGKLPKSTKGNIFSDCSAVSCQVLNQAGIIQGKSKVLFAPDDLITRQEAATVAHRALEYLGLKVTDSNVNPYIDDYLISSWAKEHVYSLLTLGIMKGDQNDYFSPNKNITVEESIAMSVRIYNLTQESDFLGFENSLNAIAPGKKG